MRREVILILFGAVLSLISFTWYAKFATSEKLVRSSLDQKDDIKENTVRLTEHRVEPGDWRPPTVPSHLQTAHQDDEELIQHIREHWIVPPFPAGEWQPADDKLHYSQVGQSQAVDELLGQMTDGFFVECGAGDGLHLSNTLFFEKQRNWSGLLVEVEPEFFDKVVRHKRHSYMVNACLSPVPHPVVLNYTKSKLMGGLESYMAEGHRERIIEKKFVSGTIEVQCFPLVSILKAIRVHQIDYFSLDVEGPEVEILKTISFNDFNVRTLTVEYRINGDTASTDKKLKAIKSLMVGKYGYKEVDILQNLDILLEKR